MAPRSTRGTLLTPLFLAACASALPHSDLPKARVGLRAITTDGKVITLASLRGRVVLLTLITTWSDLALFEVPRFAALAKRYPHDLEVIAIALDESTEMVRIFEDTFDPPYIVARTSDPERLTGSGGPFGPITVIPTSVLLDREGRPVARMNGVWPEGVLEAALERLLGQKIRSGS